MEIKLDQDDRRALQSLMHKQEHLKTAVLSLVKGHDTGLFVFGEGGTGKSYIVEEKLKELRAHYIMHNSRMTARGLVDELEAAPNVIHWIEDAETLLEDKKSFGVLRSACWSQDKSKPMRREITWTAHQTQKRFVFTGGILVISNANLMETSAEIRAIKTRIRVLKMDIENAEVIALMKTICQKGYRFGEDRMAPEECWEVGAFIIDRLAQLRRSLDLRLVKHGFNDYLLQQEHRTKLTWQEQLESRMEETATRYKGRKEKATEEQTIAFEIHRKNLTQAEKVAEWEARTGKSKAALYRALQRSA